jgi:hypothetical protein
MAASEFANIQSVTTMNELQDQIDQLMPMIVLVKGPASSDATAQPVLVAPR